MSGLIRNFNLIITLGCLSITASAAAQEDTLRVLFIGNSHTYVNDVPLLFKNLSQSGGRVVATDRSAPGGYTLEQHTTNTVTLNKISLGTWDYVVLQEQSLYPVIEYYRDSSMYPSARLLDSLIGHFGAQTALYMTWGWRYGGQHTINGHSSPDFRDFFHMQDSVNFAYTHLAAQLRALLSPAGHAWAMAGHLDSTIVLWQDDNYHATLKGSYLAACVFYAAFFRESPVGLDYTAGLTPQEAYFLQQAAEMTTLAIDEDAAITPLDFRLPQNYPNPFNAATIIEFTLLKTAPVDLVIYDIAGRRISTLIDEPVEAGGHRIFWNAVGLPSGVYLLRARIGLYSATRKMLLLK